MKLSRCHLLLFQLTTTVAFTNPPIWEDLADIDILRHNSTYYLSSSTMHFSPGAPLLSSSDLVNWRYISHSVPHLPFSPAYDLTNGQQAYNKGIWASFIGIKSGTWLWGTCIEFKKTWLFEAPGPTGPWRRKSVIDKCYYDPGLLIEGNEMYIVYGNKGINIAQISADGTREVRNKRVWDLPKNIGTLEGSRPYKINGRYYIFLTRPPDAEFVLMGNNIWGPYQLRNLVDKIKSPVDKSGAPHQGGIVQHSDGRWYYMAFIDAYPGGRIPVLAPLRFERDGWPVLEGGDKTWARSYNLPAGVQNKAKAAILDTFTDRSLGPEWEWNHNPHEKKYQLGNGLVLETATVTDDLYMARNTLTRRIPGPISAATIELDTSAMKDGDIAGLTLFRETSAYIGISKSANGYSVSLRTGMKIAKEDWKTRSKGSVIKTEQLGKNTRVWLRLRADIRPSSSWMGTFSWSVDGKEWRSIGDFKMNKAWDGFYMGYRFGVFNYATRNMGGKVLVKSFAINHG